MPTTHFPVLEPVLEDWQLLPERWNCVLTTLAIRHSLTAVLCHCGDLFWSKWSPWQTTETTKQLNINHWPISAALTCMDMCFALVRTWTLYCNRACQSWSTIWTEVQRRETNGFLQSSKWVTKHKKQQTISFSSISTSSLTVKSNLHYDLYFFQNDLVGRYPCYLCFLPA